MQRLITAMLSGCLVLSGCGGDQESGEPAEAEAAQPAANAPQPEAGPAAEEVTVEEPTGPVSDPPAGFQAPPQIAAPQTAAPKEPAGAEPDPLAGAAKLIGEMVQAYQAAPTLVDRIDAEFTMPGQKPEPQVHRIFLGKGTAARLKNAQNEIIAVGGYVYVVVPKYPDRYVKVELVGDLLTTCRQVFKSPGGLGSVQCALRYARPIDEIVAAMGFGLSQKPRLSAYRVVTDNDGRQFEQLTLVSGSGHAVVNVDPVTKFIATIEMEDAPSGAPPGFIMSRRLTFHPEVHEELPIPIAFDPGNRKAAATIRELYGLAPKERQAAKLSVQVGQAVPDFTLYTLDGEKVTLSELRGSVVVLDFWATWCIPCRKGLPLLQEFADRARNSGMPVKVYAVNGSERGGTGEDKWQKARDFWDRQQFTIPSLIDPDGRVPRSYGVTGIPTTVVIDPEGRLFSAHMGLDPNLVRSLQTEVMAALRAGD